MISNDLSSHNKITANIQSSTKSNTNPSEQTYTSQIKLLLQKNNEAKSSSSLSMKSQPAFDEPSSYIKKQKLPNVSTFFNSNFDSYDSKLTDCIYISSKSLNSLKKRRTSSSSSLSSNSGNSLSPCSNFNETDLKLLDPSKTSTPILLRNQLTKQQSFSPSIRSDTKTKPFDPIEKITSFNVALIYQKTLLKRRKENLIKKKMISINDEPYGHIMYDSSKKDQSLSSQSSVSTNSLNSSFSKNLVITNPDSGTIRGCQNHVRKSIKQVFEKESHITNPVLNAQLNNISINSLQESATYNALNDSIEPTEPTDKISIEKTFNFIARNYEDEEQQKIVIYTTTLQVVRIPYDKCKRVKKILQSYCVRYEEKDLYKNKDYQKELMYRLNLDKIDVPHIFFNGKLIANCDQLELYSDQGLLHKLFKDLEKIKLRIYCSKCGGYRYVLCSFCNGSKKKHNNFTNLKCTNCTEDGLIRCDVCLDQQE